MANDDATKVRLTDILETLDPDMLLSDGATDWTADNLLDAIRNADEEDRHDYTIRYTADGRLQIVRIREDGYLESEAAYTQRD